MLVVIFTLLGEGVTSGELAGEIVYVIAFILLSFVDCRCCDRVMLGLIVLAYSVTGAVRCDLMMALMVVFVNAFLSLL